MGRLRVEFKAKKMKSGRTFLCFEFEPATNHLSVIGSEPDDRPAPN
jgi:hypothetical protein